MGISLKRDFELLRKPESACAANIISLFLKMIPSSGYVATYSSCCSIAYAVSSVAAACWDPISKNGTRSLLFTALPTYSNAPKIY